MSAIKAGDLVMVVRPSSCCPRESGLGNVFKVGAIEVHSGPCPHCGNDITLPAAFNTTVGLWCELHRLKRIEPLADLDIAERQEEITT